MSYSPEARQLAPLYPHGIQPNLAQFLHQLLQVLLVGLAIGMMRTVIWPDL